MEVDNIEFKRTAQGFGTPVPVGEAGGKAGPPRPSASDCGIHMVGDQANESNNITGDRTINVNRHKRYRADIDSGDSEDRFNFESIVTDKFYVIKPTEGTFHTTSPFLIYQSLTKIIKEYKKVTKLRDGSLLVEIHNPEQSAKLLEIKNIGNTPVSIIPHPRLNITKGTINCPDLKNCTKEEIIENTADQKVTDILRLKKRINGELMETNTYIVSFKLTSIPEFLYIGFNRCKVRPYIPNPIMCHQCQKFGHLSKFCKSNPICPSCGKDKHEDECNPPPRCSNCLGEHSPRYKGCPKYKLEYQIQKIKTLEKLSYIEAKQFIKDNPSKYGTTYASMAATQKSLPTPNKTHPSQLPTPPRTSHPTPTPPNSLSSTNTQNTTPKKLKRPTIPTPLEIPNTSHNKTTITTTPHSTQYTTPNTNLKNTKPEQPKKLTSNSSKKPVEMKRSTSNNSITSNSSTTSSRSTTSDHGKNSRSKNKETNKPYTSNSSK